MEKAQIKEFFQTGKKPTQQQFSALIDACYNTGDNTLSNVIYVRYANNSEAYTDSFPSYDAAVAWIIANGSPSSSNPWTIMLPAGNVSENITVYANIRVQLNVGTIITGVVYSDVTFTGTEYLDAVINGGTINNLVVGAGKVLNLDFCRIMGGSPAAAFLVLTHSYSFVAIDFSAVVDVQAYLTIFEQVGENNTPYKFNNARLFGGFVRDVEFSGNSFVNNVSFLGDVFLCSAKFDAISCAFNEMISADGLKLHTLGCFFKNKPNVSVSTTWLNYGNGFDNRTSGMSANDMQAAIDELKVYIDTEIAAL